MDPGYIRAKTGAVKVTILLLVTTLLVPLALPLFVPGAIADVTLT